LPQRAPHLQPVNLLCATPQSCTTIPTSVATRNKELKTINRRGVVGLVTVSGSLVVFGMLQAPKITATLNPFPLSLFVLRSLLLLLVLLQNVMLLIPSQSIAIFANAIVQVTIVATLSDHMGSKIGHIMFPAPTHSTALVVMLVGLMRLLLLLLQLLLLPLVSVMLLLFLVSPSL
jgi:hypothetical protein